MKAIYASVLRDLKGIATTAPVRLATVLENVQKQGTAKFHEKCTGKFYNKYTVKFNSILPVISKPISLISSITTAPVISTTYIFFIRVSSWLHS